jgi:predicted glycoside hydrolase/deacetylase ChbG (UPF0249 family)
VTAGKATLIVNADDFGYTAGVTRGILAAHDEGIVTSATVMATGSAVDLAIAEAKRRPNLGIGVHLTLCDVAPAAPRDSVRSLMDSQADRFPTLMGMARRVLAGRVRFAELVAELHAQIARVVDAGIRPTHLDTHRHVIVLPMVLDAIVEAARPFGVRAIRRPLERGGWKRASAAAILKYGILAPITFRLARRARAAGFSSPDEFWGISAMGRADFAARLAAAIDAVRPGITEFMVHPGEIDAELRRIDSYIGPRETELSALRNPELRDRCVRRGIRLASYAALAA